MKQNHYLYKIAIDDNYQKKKKKKNERKKKYMKSKNLHKVIILNQK